MVVECWVLDYYLYFFEIGLEITFDDDYVVAHYDSFGVVENNYVGSKRIDFAATTDDKNYVVYYCFVF